MGETDLWKGPEAESPCQTPFNIEYIFYSWFCYYTSYDSRHLMLY
jgi:hypothetical protein